MHDPQLCEQELDGEDPRLQRATHVVTGILHGIDCAAIFSLESENSYEKSINSLRVEVDRVQEISRTNQELGTNLVRFSASPSISNIFYKT